MSNDPQQQPPRGDVWQHTQPINHAPQLVRQPQQYQYPTWQQQSYPTSELSATPPPARMGNMFGRRIGRLGFLLGLVYSFSAPAASVLLLAGIGASGILPDSPGGPGLAIFNLFALLLNFVAWGLVILVSLSVVVRRLHDLNLSGWAALLYFMPFVGILLVLFLLFKPGQEPNKYGPRITSLNFWDIIGRNIKVS